MTQDSMLTGLRMSQVRLVARYWVRFSLRTGGGLVALLLVLLVGLSVASIFIQPVEMLMQASPEMGHEEQEAAAMVAEVAESDQFVDFVEEWLGADETQARYLLQTQPALLSVIFLVLLICFPFLACIGAFNQTAGDIGNRGLRYLLLRTERPNVFLGRFLGTVGFAMVSVAVLFSLLLLYIGLKFGVYPWGDLILWSLQAFLAILLLVLPYLAMCAWLSALLDSAFGAFVVCFMLAGFPILFVKMADVVVKADLDWLLRLLPWGWKYELLSHDIVTRMIAALVMIGFTAVFLALGLRAFHKRDL